MTEDAFLQAILADPDDDAPRLIFADWLDEHSDSARAEFIRVQCELARLPSYEARWWRLSYRENNTPQKMDWKKELPTFPGLEWPGFTFQRGFAARVKANSAHAFLDAAESLFRTAPIQELETERWGLDDIAALADSPWLARLHSLHFSLRSLNNATIERLAESPFAAGLSRLAFSFGGIQSSGVEALIASRLFPQLTSLDLSNNNYTLMPGQAAARALTAVAPSPRLVRLNLTATFLTAHSLHLLASAPALQSLLDLNVSENYYRFDPTAASEGIQALLTSRHLTSLTQLSLGRMGVKLRDIRVLAESKSLPALRSLALLSNDLGPASSRMLADSPILAGLRELDLQNNPIGDKGVIALAKSPHLRQLCMLNLSRVKMTNAGLRAFADSPIPDQLAKLMISEGGSLDRALIDAVYDRMGN